MKKISIFFLLMAMIMPLAMNAQSQTYSFSNIPTSGWNTSGGTVTINNVSWSYSSATYLGVASNSIQVGSRNNPQTSNWTIQTPISSFGSNIMVTGVSITGYTTRTTATYDISVNGTSVKSGSLTTSSATYSATNLNYTSGNIVVTMKGSSNSRAMYLSNITVTYESLSNCHTPQDLAVGDTSITQTAATVTWTAGDATLWNLQYKKASASTWTSVTGLTTASYSFTGLDASTEYEVQVQADCGDEQSDWTSSVTFMTECGIQSLPFFCGFESATEYGCLEAISLADNSGLSTSTYHSGRSCFMFEGNGAWQYLIFPEFDGTSAVEVSFYYRLRSSSYQHSFMLGYAKESDLSDLTFGTQETATSQSYVEYTATFPKGTKYVILGCGASSGTNYRLFVDDFNFTALTGCIDPDGLKATDITPHSATLSWNDYSADSYNVRYRKAGNEQEVFFDGFESGIGNWTTTASSYSSTNTNWRQFDATNFSSGNVTNHTGDYVAMSRSYDGSTDRTVDNWLISPQIALNGELRYWVRNGDGAGYYEHYAVYVSTSGTSTSNFTLLYDPNDATDDWLLHVVDLSSYNGVNGYIAFRHNETGQDFLLLDDVGVYTVEYSAWTTVPATGGEIDIDQLDPESTYQWQVQPVCSNTPGDWSSVVYFQTLTACAAPTDLNATDITATTATLNWADYHENYDVRYKQVFYFEGFEDGIPSSWTTIDSDGDGNTWIALSDIPSHYSQYSASGVSGWARTGSNAACSPSYVNTSSSNGTAFNSDQWLISPLLDLQGLLKFYITSSYADEYEVMLSTTGTNVSDFTVTLQAMSAVSADWDEVEIDLSSYAGQQGYIGIHHVFEDGYFLIVDDFSISSNTWETASATTNSVAINGLAPSTTYEWQVSGDNCDEWSSNANFSTLFGVVKEIIGYNESKGGYYLIATPIDGLEPSEVVGMIPSLESDYDLYSFDDAEENEWRNFKLGRFTTLESGKGYLYASKITTNLVFTGTPYSGDGKVTLHKTDGAEFEGWNLVGNPFTETAYLADGREFYVMNPGGTGFIEGGTEIGLMEGIFVIADNDGDEITFTTTPPTKANHRITLNVCQKSQVIDRAVVRFDDTKGLPKLQLNENSTKVYIPQNGKDYAVIQAESQDEIPVSFKAEKNGTYTLNFSAENAEFSYLHLIDNMTGNEVDLLETPSYSFDAQYTDYASRFKLVFAKGNNDMDSDFAFISDGQIILTGAENGATVQVIDALGRVIAQNDANNTIATDGMSAGVYVIRLINGSNVKTQKIVVK